MTFASLARAYSDACARGEIRGLDWAVAYLGRYAHQARSEVLAMTLRQINRVVDEVSDIVTAENESGQGTGGELPPEG